ncbi:hypothetical protein Q9R38_25975 [Priestia aryabhattai]|uniref:hypothetical protein n=1 Tax=Priestia aryabhattai TaxID=412384 RepID=UPI002880E0BB|nr:hypothetical protein [Priestia aryabhattai]MDT0149992.1 hypothetical protein [Priestia aryabhattai]MDT0155562.1 hypothetical protein [Priestia aryabhattai]
MLNTKLHAQYDGIKVLSNGKHFTVNPTEIYLFQSELVENKIMSAQRVFTACHILTFKHDEKNPFPSNETLASHFKKSVRAIAASVSDILKTGLFINEKGKYGTDKRKNTYNVTPFLNLLGVFVEHFREGKAYDFKELYNNVIKGVLKAERGSVEEKVEAPKLEELPEAITEALNAVENEEQRSILEKEIRRNMNRLDEETLIYYISRVQEKFDSSKGTFASASYTFYKAANNGDKEKHKQMDAERYKRNTGNSKGRKEVEPEFLKEQKEAEQEYRKECPIAQRERQAHNAEVDRIVSEGLQKAYVATTGLDIEEDNGFPYMMWKMELMEKLPEGIEKEVGSSEIAIYNTIYPNSVQSHRKIV